MSGDDFVYTEEHGTLDQMPGYRAGFEAGRRDAFVLDEQAVERVAKALFDLREECGIRPVVSRWPPADADDADEYRLEARAVVAALRNEQEDR